MTRFFHFYSESFLLAFISITNQNGQIPGFIHTIGYPTKMVFTIVGARRA